MNATEKLIDRDLKELLGGETPPDLIAQTLARLERGDVVPEPAPEAHEPAPTGRLIMLRRLATAACVALAVGLITWVLWPQPLPETVTASTGANYLVRDDHIQLNQGWLLLTDGAPQVRTDSGRVSVTGRAVVGPAIPGDDALDALADQFGLSAEERVMFKMRERWLTAASLAICLFSGQAMFNGEVVNAEDLPRPKAEPVEIPAHDDIEGLRALLRGAIKVEVMSEDRRIVLEDLFHVRRITEALTAQGFAISDKALGWDPWDGVTMYLKDGRKIETSGLSWEEDVYDMRLPGSKRYYTYVTPKGAHDVMREYFQQAKEQDSVDHEPFRVLRKWEGNDSEVAESRCEVIGDEEAWASLWREHSGVDENPNNLPDVDFEKELVVAVFGGRGFDSAGYRVRDILNARNGWVIRVAEEFVRRKSGDSPEVVNAYGIWVIPNDGGSVVVEENIQSDSGVAPLWKSIGGRLGTDDLRDDTKDYQPTHIITRKGGPEVPSTEYHVIRSLNEWEAALGRINDDSARWPDPDFSDEIAVMAIGNSSGAGNFVLDVWGFTGSSLHLRIIAPQGRDAVHKPVYGVWVMKRPALDIVIEAPSYGRVGEPARWQTALAARQMDEAFGIYDDIYGTDDEVESKFLLIDNQAELEEHVENVAADWVDWSSERVVLMRHKRMRVFVGMSATVRETDTEHVITYHLTAPSGVVAEPVTQYLVLKIRKPTKTLIVKQSLKTGPSPADVTEVARFEK